MKLVLIKFLFISLISLNIYGQIIESGVLDKNAEFTTWKGKDLDIKSILNSGKYIYFLTFKYPG